MKVGIADDDGFVRGFLSRTLDEEPDIDVIWSVETGDEALQKSQKQPTDAILMDLNMPGLGGIETIKKLNETPNPPSIVVISSLASPDKVQSAFRAGAVGYFMKEDSPNLIAVSLRRALQGELVFSPQCSRLLIEQLTDASPVSTSRNDGNSMWDGVLTNRELEVLRLMADSLENKQIARELAISVETVKNHVHAVTVKLGAQNRVGAVANAFRAGLLN